MVLSFEEQINMIRRFELRDLSDVMEIWLGGNIDSHYFIETGFWTSNFAMVETSIVSAEVYVYIDNKVILGFIGLEGDHIEGLFVKKDYRSQGIGKQLIDYAKVRHSKLSLSVYERNSSATKFYEREGFKRMGTQLNHYTGEVECVMQWSSSSAQRMKLA